MTLRHLKLFIAVVDYKTMSNAAKKMFISQPSVSQAIREIEDYYDIRIFERLSQKLYLTSDGEKFLKYARHIIDTFENMQKEFKEKGQVYIRIGGSLAFGTYLLPNIMHEFEEKFKKIKPKIIIDNTTNIEQKLINNEIDLGIVEGEIKNEDIIKIPIFRDYMSVVIGANNKILSNKTEINVEELSGLDIISREDGCIERSYFQKVLNERDVVVNFKWYCTSNETIKNVIKESNAFSALSTMAIKDEIEKGELKEIKLKNIELYRDLCLVYHKNKFITEEIKYFIELCKTKRNVQF